MLFCALCLIGYDTANTPELAITIVNGNAVCGNHFPECRFNKDTINALKESARRCFDDEPFYKRSSKATHQEVIDAHYSYESANPVRPIRR